MKKVYVIVLNYNGLKFTKDCYESLVNQESNNKLGIVIVDNASTECDISVLQSSCPKAEIVQSKTNSGFAGGMNQGIRYVINNHPDYDYIWILNNDTVCDKNTLELNLKAFEKDEHIGVVGCRLIQGTGEKKGKVVPAGALKRPPFYLPQMVDDNDKIDFLCGATLFIKRKVIEEVGLLDEGYFFFSEDADYSFRVVKAGFKLAVAEGVPIKHLGSATISKNAYKQVYNFRRGHIRFISQHGTHPIIASFIPMVYRSLVCLLRLRFSAFRGNIMGYIDGVASLIKKESND